jgi:uncharacterized protein (DUF58 family)
MALDAHTLRLLDTFAIRARRSFYGARQGTHRSQRRGHGVEFAEYRSYELGDNPRYIDWNLYARSDKIYVKRYLEEETVSVFMVIDGSPSLTHPALQLKWHAAAHLATCASYIALSSQDPVTVSILGGRHSPQFWGARSFAPLGNFLEAEGERLAQGPHTKVDIVEAARLAATRVRFPGICVVVSDFIYPLEDVVAMLSWFRSRNMEVHAVQMLGAQDIDPDPQSTGSTLVDSETGEEMGLSLDASAREHYAKKLAQHSEAIRHHCLSAHIHFVQAEAREPLAENSISILSAMGLFV